ncbi:MAG: GNAT family N-acetyltransferase [Segetibacter sp.]
MEELLDDDRSYLIAAISDGIVYGYTLAYRFPSLYASEYLAYLYDIEVSLKYRRKGIGLTPGRNIAYLPPGGRCKRSLAWYSS